MRPPLDKVPFINYTWVGVGRGVAGGKEISKLSTPPHDKDVICFVVIFCFVCLCFS
jgi:hypothetical protein